MNFTDISTISGIITISISVVGGYVALSQFLFFRRSKKTLSQRLGVVFFSDCLIYGITAVFGLWAFFGWGQGIAIIFHFIRMPILLLNIWASYRLYRHYKELQYE